MDEALAELAIDAATWAARPAWSLSDGELAGSIRCAHAVVTAMTAGLASLVAEAHGRDLPHRDGAASTVTWLRDALRIASSEARQLLALGLLLDVRPAIGESVRAGTVNTAQAL
ncbi:MAG TPA: hypothetical protein VKB59_22125, partial [Micromonosporaceae bacterium]|nr:hypothetical protein [Micromonosporaceae bacterium]